jgi:hypothetical protein
MKSQGRYRVDMWQRIHNRIYHFGLCVMASSPEEAKKKAETTFTGYKAYSAI